MTTLMNILTAIAEILAIPIGIYLTQENKSERSNTSSKSLLNDEQVQTGSSEIPDDAKANDSGDIQNKANQEI